MPHDAREPLQYVATDGRSKLGVLTDVGQSTPHLLEWNQWHKPYYTDKPQYVASDEGDRIDICMASAGACARVSYAAFDGQQSDEANEGLAERLAKETPSHGSPFEHVVRASMDGDGYRRAGRQCLRGNWETLRAIKRL